MPEITVIPARNKSGDIIRAAAYARVSSSSDDQLNSFNAQIKYYTELLKNSTNTVFVDMYADEGITGTSAAKRDEFQRLMNDCRKGKIDRILTKSVSRFARNTKDCLEAVRELKSLGVSVYFEKEKIDTGELSSEMLLTLYSQFAQEESMSISRNCRMGIHKRMADGSYITPTAAYGYKLVNGRLEIDASKSKIVKRIFRMFLSGMGTEAIANELNKIHAPLPMYAVKWYHTTVKYILENERYIGDSLYQKSFATDTLPISQLPNNGEKPQYYVEKTHEPIISREDFQAVQNIILQRSIPPEAKIYTKSPLSRKIRCKACGAAFRRRKVGEKIYWICRTHSQQSAAKCRMKPIVESELNNAFIRLYNKLSAHCSDIILPMYRQLQRLADLGESANTQVAEIRREVAEQKEQSHLLAQLNSQGIIEPVYFAARSQELDRNLVQLQNQLHSMLDGEDDERLDNLRKLISVLEKAERLTEFDEEKFGSIVEKITVLSESKIRFELVGGVGFNEQIQRKGR